MVDYIDLAGPVSICIATVGGMVIFFWYFGIFKFPWYVFLAELLNGLITIIMTFALLPYDISLSLLNPVSEQRGLLRTVIESLYWSTWLFAWCIMPCFVSVFQYNYALSWCKRIWYGVRYNLLFYGTAGFFIVLGLVIVAATKGLTFDTLKSLMIALANMFGMFLFVILVGHSLVALPRSIWRNSKPIYRVREIFFRIVQESEGCCQSYVDGVKILQGCDHVYNNLPSFLRPLIKPSLDPRKEKLQELTLSRDMPAHLYNICRPSKKACSFEKTNWKDASITDMEMFLKNCDAVIRDIEQTHYFIHDSCVRIEPALNKVILSKTTHKHAATLDMVLRRAFCILICLLNGVVYWGQFCVMINKPKISLFYLLDHLRVPVWCLQIFMIFPTLGYVLYLCGWSLTKFRLGNYYRFIPGVTNEDTMYFWIAIMVKACPTIGYNYLLQIDALDSQTFKVLGEMKQIPVIGDYYNQFVPVIMFIVSLLVGFNVWDKALGRCGTGKYVFDESLSSPKDISKGISILRHIRPELNTMLDHDAIREKSIDRLLLESDI